MPRFSSFAALLYMQKNLILFWPIVIWLAIGNIPASLATTWVFRKLFESIPTHYKAILTMVLGFMLTITGISIVFPLPR